MKERWGARAMAEREVARGSGGWVRRPDDPGGAAVAYVRPRPGLSVPIVMIPGGPGLASAVPYRALRRRAVARGLDVIMMEHRGIGLSRRDQHGVDLDVDAVTVQAAADDLAAVLDDCGVARAVIYGASYGSHLAQVFGVRHPDRVTAMVLDSPMLSVLDDVAAVRSWRRDLFWNGDGPLARLVRELHDRDPESAATAGEVVQVTYEFAGPEVLHRLLTARLDGRAARTWRRLATAGQGEAAEDGRAYVMEMDLVRGILYGELGYHHAPDGQPLDPQEFFARHAPADAPPFRGEPLDLRTRLPRFTWPTAVVSGERDLRTPRPVAEQIVDLVPGAVLVPLAETGHSALDTHQLAALNIAHVVRAGGLDQLPRLADRIAALPLRGVMSAVGTAIRAHLAVDLGLSRVRRPRAATSRRTQTAGRGPW